MAECNGCGNCCHPLRIDRKQWLTILKFVNMPHPDDPAWRAWAEANLVSYDLDAESTREHALRHYANARFAKAHWVDNIREENPLEVVIRCPHYSVNRRMCRAYDDRPPICADYPWYEGAPGEKAKDRLQFIECSYWADAPEEERPKGWVLITAEEIKVRR
jgi:Fe-S-cluster containining protein